MGLSAASEGQLVIRAAGGDQEAFGELIRRYQDAVFGLAYSNVRNFADAEDIAQEVFLSAWRALRKLRDRASFAPWLRSITLNEVRTYVRARGRRQRREEKHAALEEARAADGRAAAREGVLPDAVTRELGRLSAPRRVAATLHYINGYSCREVSGFLGVPLGTVKRRLHEARQVLKGRLAMVEEDLKRRRPGPAFSRRVLQRIDSVQVEVKDETAGGLLLTDKKGRSFLVLVARPEALSISMALHAVKFRRPLTHDLFVNTIKQLGGTIVELVISALKENTFYGVLVIRLGRDRHEIDCRPSDGVALALRAGAPIYIHKDVADRVVMKRKDGRPLSPAGALRAVRKRPIVLGVSEEDRKKIAEGPGALEAFDEAARLLAEWHSTGKSEPLAGGLEWFGKYLERKPATRGFPPLPPLPLAAYRKLEREKAFQEVMKKYHLSLTVQAAGMKIGTTSR